MTYAIESHMPGPTDEAKTLQLKQYAAYDAMYGALNKLYAIHAELTSEIANADPEYSEKKQAYDDTVNQLKALLGPQAHCNQVDCDLWSAFSDIHKSEHGYRPRGHYTAAEVREQFEALVGA